MPFVAGAIIGTAELDDSKWNAGIGRVIESSDKMEKTTKSNASKVESTHKKMGTSVFTSMLTAQAAYGLAVKAFNFLTGTFKRGIVEFAKQEKAETSLKTALGKTSQELINQATQMQRLTGVADDSIIQGQAYLAQMRLNEQQIKKITPAIIDFAKAQDGNVDEAFKTVAKTLGNNTNMLSRYGVQVEGAAGSNERLNSAVTNLTQKFGGQAEALRKTWSGTVEALNNSTGDLLEIFGQFATTKGKGFLNFLEKGISSLTGFLTAGQNLKNVKAEQAELNNLATRLMSVNDNQELRNATIKELNSKYPGFLRNMDTENLTLGQIKDRLIDANKEYYRKITLMTSNQTLEEKSIKASMAAREVINAELKIRDEINKNINDKNILSKIEGYSTEQQYQILKNLLQAENLDENAKWQIRDALSAVNDIAGDYTNKLIKQEKAFKDLNKEQKINEEIIKRLSDSSNEYIIEKKREIDRQKEVALITQMTNQQMIESYKEYVENKKILDGEIKTDFDTYLKAKNSNEKKMLNESFRNYVAWKENLGGLAGDVQDKAKEMATKVLGIIAQVADKIKEIYSSIYETVSMFMDNEVAAIEIANNKKIDNLTANKEKTLESIDDEYAQRQEMLDSQLENNLISQGAYNEQSDLLEQQKADAKAAAEADADAKIEATKRANAKKLDKAKKKQFEAEKSNQIASIWMQFAIGTIAAFAQGIAQLGPVAGAIIGAAMTAIMLAIAIAQTVAVSQKQYVPTALATGGRFGDNETLLVGERGPELLTSTTAGYVTPSSITDKVLNNINDSMREQNTTINMEGAFKGATISNALDLKYVTKYVIDQLGQKLGLAR